MRKIVLALTACICCWAGSWALPRAEYPRPQFERADWLNLNGEWSYTLDLVKTGWERGLKDSKGFDGKIIVPFAPESKLSGVEYKEFIPCIWYQRNITIPAEWDGKDILLHFGAVYYESEIYIDGKFVDRHFGGSDSFTVDITPFVKPGQTHSLVVNAKSDLRSRMQSAGKQSLRHGPFECMYTRTTGIWQTVWMEAVAPCAIERVKYITDIDRNTVSMEFTMRRNVSGNTLTVTVKDGNKTVASNTAPIASGSVVSLPIKKAKWWSPESPFLYDVVFELKNAAGDVIDRVTSYFGMRKIHTEGNKIYLNNQPYYQRLVLDQGFYPDGIWTAPSDEALKRDIELSMAAGFNGARLHQKVFEERFYYWADKLGYLTWGEAPSWGLDANNVEAARNFLMEWRNLVVRDINHPSLVTWTPFNEEFWPDETQYPRFITDVYTLTKQLDPSRPINGVSGGIHIKTDIWTEHHYEQNPERLREIIYNDGKMFVRGPEVQARLRGNVGFNRPVLNDPYTFPTYQGDIPYILDEFGGIKCMEANPAKDGAWGYGDAAQTKEDFYKRLEGQVRVLIEMSDKVWGYCYTQLTDVEQEQNGIYYYDRGTKYDMERVKAIFQMALPEQK
ncbi:MAG TPA: beta-glucuronidase [Candidatus Gallibacteroides avistercoris]|uniref:Beta-glucuronidase n=1 Tax=Candidatus Gallibacteroides avistercoris TaxID=2840833 RepID=A0A9D1SCL4_9BACT|nr:beta-glucuronidase [Candidatus Gallibacteroides avistercoris]